MKTETKTAYDAKMRRRKAAPKKGKKRVDEVKIRKATIVELMKDRDIWSEAAYKHASHTQIVLKKRKRLHNLLRATRRQVALATDQIAYFSSLSKERGAGILLLAGKRKRLHDELKVTREALRLACRSSIHAPIYYTHKARTSK